MDCSQDLTCHLLDWLSSSGYLVRQIFTFIETLWNAAGGQIAWLLKEHGEKLVALASFAFAAYRWWIYRERILFKRLEEYIRDSDRRLIPTSVQMMDAALRPGRPITARRPAYAIEINGILDSRGWKRFLSLAPFEAQAQQAFHQALLGIRKRQETVEAAAQSLERQKAEIYKIRGVVAAAYARRSADKVKAAQLDEEALSEFRHALQCTTHRRDVLVKECEAVQLLRLGHLDVALDAFLDLESFADDLDTSKQRDLTKARAKRYQAQILQAQAGDAGSLAAWTSLALQNNGDDRQDDSALDLRYPHAPFTRWDQIEQGEMHYLAAYIANRNAFARQEPRQLELAGVEYGKLLRSLPKRLIFLRRATRHLRTEAQAGADRVKLRQLCGRYDREWLMMPASEEPQ